MKHALVLLIVFIGWSALSVDWYVCGLKKQCQVSNAKAAIPKRIRFTEPLIVEADDFIIKNRTIYYGSRQSAPQQSESIQAFLEELVKLHRQFPEMQFEVQGHTDSTGSDRLNHELALTRAQEIKNMLIALSVPYQNIEAVSYGETLPQVSNRTRAGREQNRRVEIKIFNSKGEEIK